MTFLETSERINAMVLKVIAALMTIREKRDKDPLQESSDRPTASDRDKDQLKESSETDLVLFKCNKRYNTGLTNKTLIETLVRLFVFTLSSRTNLRRQG